MQGELRLRGLENGERSRSATEVEQATTAGGDVLVVAGTEAEEGAELVVASAEPLRRSEALEPPHTSDAAFDAAVILLKPVVLVGTGPAHDMAAERTADRPRSSVPRLAETPR